jgi:hypothetical protein
MRIRLRIRPSIGALLSGVCCAGLAACTAAASSGPVTTVTTPSVGRAAPPDSAQAALSSMAFTPYAALGQSNNDGLAPGESPSSLGQACLSTAGYPGLDDMLPKGVSIGGDLAFAFDWGSWGYLGMADAQQYGFAEPIGSALAQLGLSNGDGSSQPQNPSTLPAAEQDALGKCAVIEQDFSDQMASGPLAGIASMGNDIATDVAADPAVVSATKAWKACMAKNGYTVSDPETTGQNEMRTALEAAPGKEVAAQQPSSAVNTAQIAEAVTDTDCTTSSDLAGIYLAVQASYEQQIVDANTPALATAVQQFRTDYQREVNKLPQLLKTTKALPFKGKGVKVVEGRAVSS